MGSCAGRTAGPCWAGKDRHRPPQSCSDPGPPAPVFLEPGGLWHFHFLCGWGSPACFSITGAPGPDFPTAGGWITRGRRLISGLSTLSKLGLLHHRGAVASCDQAGKTVTPGQATGPLSCLQEKRPGTSWGCAPSRPMRAAPQGPAPSLRVCLLSSAQGYGTGQGSSGLQAGLAGRVPEPNLPNCGSG